MPAYSFQERFVPMVLDGTKTNTIRARRNKGFAKKGDTVYLYFGMRTKWCKKLKQATCKKAVTVMIQKNKRILLWNRRLTDAEVWSIEVSGSIKKCQPDKIIKSTQGLNRFAWLDGFRPEGTTLQRPTGAYDFMIRFWNQTHQLPFIGDIIYW